MPSYSKSMMKAALQANHGLISPTAKQVGCNRQTIYNMLTRWPDLAAVIQEEREALIDLAEEGLYEALCERRPWAILFTLNRLGRARGYGEKDMLNVTPKTDLDSISKAEWQHIQTVMLEALEPHMEARVAVADALSRLNGDGHSNGAGPSA